MEKEREIKRKIEGERKRYEKEKKREGKIEREWSIRERKRKGKKGIEHQERDDFQCMILDLLPFSKFL